MGCFFQERPLTCDCAEQCWGFLGSSTPWASLLTCCGQGIVSSSGLFPVQTKRFSDAEFICLRKRLFEAVHAEENNSQSPGSARGVSTGVARSEVFIDTAGRNLPVLRRILQEFPCLQSGQGWGKRFQVIPATGSCAKQRNSGILSQLTSHISRCLLKLLSDPHPSS